MPFRNLGRVKSSDPRARRNWAKFAQAFGNIIGDGLTTESGTLDVDFSSLLEPDPNVITLGGTGKLTTQFITVSGADVANASVTITSGASSGGLTLSSPNGNIQTSTSGFLSLQATGTVTVQSSTGDSSVIAATGQTTGFQVGTEQMRITERTTNGIEMSCDGPFLITAPVGAVGDSALEITPDVTVGNIARAIQVIDPFGNSADFTFSLIGAGPSTFTELASDFGFRFNVAGNNLVEATTSGVIVGDPGDPTTLNGSSLSATTAGSVLVTAGTTMTLIATSGINVFSAITSFSTITATTAPTIGGHLTNKTYVDGLISGVTLPAGVIQMWGGGTTPPTGWLLLNGDTMGNGASGGTHAGAEFEDLFDIVKDMAPNAGTEVFADDDTVTLPDMDGRSPIGIDSGNTDIDAMGETAGALTHTHDVNIGNTTSGVESATQGIAEGMGAIQEVPDLNHTHDVDPASETTTSSSSLHPVLTLRFIIKT